MGIERILLRELIGNISDPVVFFEIVGEKAVIRHVNKSFENVFGFKESEVAGRSVDDLIVPEKDISMALEINRKVGSGQIVCVEVVRKARDGLRFFELMAIPAFTGAKQHGLAIYRDITEKKILQDKILESERRYRELFENSLDALVVVDQNLSFVEVNKAFEFVSGYRKNELAGKNLGDLVEKSSFRKLLSNMKKKKRIRRMKIELKDKKGRRKILEGNLRYINGSEIILQFRDVTQLIRLEKLLRTINKINKLVLRENDVDRLLSKSAKLLSSVEPGFACWIGLIEEGNVKRRVCTGYSCVDRADMNFKCFKKAYDKRKTVLIRSATREKICPAEWDGNCTISPMIVEDKVTGFVVLHSTVVPSKDELDLMQTLSDNIAFKIKALELEEAKKIAYGRIEDNIVKFATLADEIRNPLAAILAYAEIFVPDEVGREKIKSQVERVEKVLDELDRGWLESEKVREFLRRTWKLE